MNAKARHSCRRAPYLGLAAIVVATHVYEAPCADWPQIYGSRRDSMSDETALARSWPTAGPPVCWKVPLGKGFAGPAVRDNEVYLLDRIEDTADVLHCWDLETGRPLWSFRYEAPGRVLEWDGSRNTPAVDKEYIYIIGPMGDFHCLDRKTHQVVWKTHFVKDFGGGLTPAGISRHPLLYRDTVILAPMGRGGLLAFDKATGTRRWSNPKFQLYTHSSPVLVTIDGVDQVAMIGLKGMFAASAADGSILWRYGDGQFPVVAPTAVGEGRLLLTDGGENESNMKGSVNRYSRTSNA